MHVSYALQRQAQADVMDLTGRAVLAATASGTASD